MDKLDIEQTLDGLIQKPKQKQKQKQKPKPKPKRKPLKPKPNKIKFVGQGAYGCIFRPFIQCTNSTKPTNSFFISKIQKNTTDIENEVNIGKIVSEIPSSRHFYAAIEQTCKVNINQIPDNELNKCDIVKNSIDKQIDKNTKYVSSKIRFVSGKSITHTLLHLFHNPKQMLVKMIKSNLHLLAGIKKLIELSDPVIHYDIKDGNVIYSDTYGNPIIIDFGLSFKRSDITPEKMTKIFYTYESYTPWCVDIIILSYISQKIVYDRGQSINSTAITDEDVQEMLQVFTMYMESNEVMGYRELISVEEYQKYNSQIVEYLKSYTNKYWKELFDDLVSNYMSWDNFSAAITYLLVIYDILIVGDERMQICIIEQSKEQQSKDNRFHKCNWLVKYISILKRVILGVPLKSGETVEPDKHRPTIKQVTDELVMFSSNVSKTEFENMLVHLKKIDAHVVESKISKYYKSDYKNKVNEQQIHSMRKTTLL